MNYRVKNIGIAVALAALAAILTSVYVVNYKRHVQHGEDKVPVLVAARDIPARPLWCCTVTAAQPAAAQVGKRCQLSNRTRHGYIIAHTYDNAPGVAWPAVP